jgi:DNA-binding transcriptional ArsR family regulator
MNAELNRGLSGTAALLSDPGRAAMAVSLMGGVALPAGQLAMIANVSAQTASSHLAQLVAGRLLSVEKQGRHRYYRLADEEVAQAVETLLAIATRHETSAVKAAKWKDAAARFGAPVGTMAYARTCYSHLAGQLAVQIAEGMIKREYLQARKPRGWALTARGRERLERFGLNFSEAQRENSRFAKQCLDWTERRHHVAGHLGTALLKRFKNLKWVVPVRESRAVRVTVEGGRGVKELLGILIPRV